MHTIIVGKKGTFTYILWAEKKGHALRVPRKTISLVHQMQWGTKVHPLPEVTSVEFITVSNIKLITLC